MNAQMSLVNLENDDWVGALNDTISATHPGAMLNDIVVGENITHTLTGDFFANIAVDLEAAEAVALNAMDNFGYGSPPKVAHN